MKTPKEYAIELVDKYWSLKWSETANHTRGLFYKQMTKDAAKQCALICVNEIIKHHDSLFDLGLKDVHQTFTTPTEIYNDVLNPAKKYLEEVLKEIENLK